MMVFSRSGGNGSYIEFEDGTVVDTVSGDSYYPEGSTVPQWNSVSELVDWANSNGLDWTDTPPATTDWSAADIEEYVGA